MDSASPELSQMVPRELLAELLAIARSGGASFADAYAEHAIVTGASLDEGRLKTASYSVLLGVGVRAIRGEQTGYAYADGFAPEAMREAARVASRIARESPSAATGRDGTPIAFRVADAPAPFELRDPATLALDEEAKVALLRRADETARAHDPRVREVSASFGTSARFNMSTFRASSSASVAGSFSTNGGGASFTRNAGWAPVGAVAAGPSRAMRAATRAASRSASGAKPSA